MPNIDKESRIVGWLLHRYQLWHTRCRLMLRDLDIEYGYSAQRTHNSAGTTHARLTLAAFDYFFQSHYPLAMGVCSGCGKTASDISARDLFCRLGSTKLIREFDQLACSVDGRPIALLCPWLHERDIERTLVVHNRRTVDAAIAGPHFIQRFDDGTVLVMEPLGVLLASVDAETDATTWMAHARDSHFDTPVARHGSN